jgi:hypothetical protein
LEGSLGKESTLSHGLLFDLRADPGERQDVAQQHGDLIRELRSRVAQWEADVNAEAKERVVTSR